MIYLKSTLISQANIDLFSYNFLTNIYLHLEDLNKEYGGFYNWYYSKIIPGIYNGTRAIILKEAKNNIVAITILKKDTEEEKICTFRVNKDFKEIGIGTELMEHSLDVLNNDSPIITVSSKNILQFTKLLDNYNFKLTDSYESYYIKGLTEYSFNGYLTNNTLTRKTNYNNFSPYYNCVYSV